MSHYFLLKSFTELGALRHDEGYFFFGGERGGGGGGGFNLPPEHS